MEATIAKSEVTVEEEKMLTNKSEGTINEEKFEVIKRLSDILNLERKGFTIKEVLHELGNYLWSRTCYNPKNPTEIILGDDPLAAIFGLQNFPMRQLPLLLRRCLVPLSKVTNMKQSADFNRPASTVNSQSVSMVAHDCAVTSANFTKDVSGDGIVELQKSENFKSKDQSSCLKRAADGPLEGASTSKMSCVSLQDFAFQMPVIPTYDSESDSALSIQSKTTIEIFDTDELLYRYDRLYMFESSSEAIEGLEFEVQSLDSSVDISDTDSDIEDVIFAAVGIIKGESDVEFWADVETEKEESSDPEMLGDKWYCRKCQTKNKPLVRNCRKCWEQRFGWLPDNGITQKNRAPRRRPRRKPRNKRRRAEVNKDFAENINTQSTATDGSQELLESQQSEFAIESSQADGPCPLCFKHARTGVIMHGRTSHQYCCYQCARNLEDRGMRCPVCQKAIKYVTRNYIISS